MKYLLYEILISGTSLILNIIIVEDGDHNK